MTDEQSYAAQLDAEAVAHARSKPWPAPGTVRRVRVDNEGPTSHQARVSREMAQAVQADHERERRGADDGAE